MQGRCLAVQPHPHFESDDEDLFPIYGDFKVAAKVVAGNVPVSEAKADDEPPVPARCDRKRRKTKAPGWGGSRHKACDLYGTFWGPLQPATHTRLWEQVDARLRERQEAMALCFAKAFGDKYKPTLAVAIASFTHPEAEVFNDEPDMKEVVNPAKRSRSISTQT